MVGLAGSLAWMAIQLCGALLATSDLVPNRDGGICAREPQVEDAVYRTRDAELLKELAALKSRCGSRWAEDGDCLSRLRDLRTRELQLFSDVRGHQFRDLTESNYWHRGRLKFPGETAQLLDRAGDAGRNER
jgi:hypothetical protein